MGARGSLRLVLGTIGARIIILAPFVIPGRPAGSPGIPCAMANIRTRYEFIQLLIVRKRDGFA
jgi:hypothetical protein